jgi:hypothetical protein
MAAWPGTGLSRDRIGEIIGPSSEESKARKQDYAKLCPYSRLGLQRQEGELESIRGGRFWAGVRKLWANFQRHVVLGVMLTSRI